MSEKEEKVILGLEDVRGGRETMERKEPERDISCECCKAPDVSESTQNDTYLVTVHTVNKKGYITATRQHVSFTAALFLHCCVQCEVFILRRKAYLWL